MIKSFATWSFVTGVEYYTMIYLLNFSNFLTEIKKVLAITTC
jgi:hypothetical protein